MALCNMIELDEDALVCDLAEAYHIFDYESLPLKKVAIFSLGLRADSRIKTKMRGENQPLDIQLLAIIADSLRTLVWFKTEDGMKGRNRPDSIYANLTEESKDDDIEGFASGEELDKAIEKLRKGG